MKPEDLEYISNELENLNDLIQNLKFKNKDEVLNEINRIKNEAKDRNVPIFFDQNIYVNKFINKDNGIPPEYYEDEESEEISED